MPQKLGFGCGLTAWRRLRAWQRAGVWVRLHEQLLAELNAADSLEWKRAIADSRHLQAKKGRQNGSQPGRSRPARQQDHLVVDGGGVPLAWTLTGGNRNDVTQLLELLDRVPPVRGRAAGHDADHEP